MYVRMYVNEASYAEMEWQIDIPKTALVAGRVHLSIPLVWSDWGTLSLRCVVRRGTGEFRWLILAASASGHLRY